MTPSFPVTCKILILSFLLSSCGILPSGSQLKTKEESLFIPSEWTTRLDNGTDAHLWVRKFKDPSLSKLVDEALKHNYSLQAAALRIDQLKAAELITKGRQKPTLSTSAGVSNSGSLDDYKATESTPYNLSFSSRWELDLWGRLRKQRTQAELQTTEAKADYFAAKLSLAGSVCSAYFNLLSAESSQSLAQETLQNYQKSLRIIERNYKAGVPGVDALDVQFGRNNVTSAMRSLSEAKLNLSRTSQAIEILLGRYPKGILRSERPLPAPLSALPNTLPAGMIEQRPDLISSRAELSRLLTEVDIREKNLLPSIRLTGNLRGDSSVSLSKLLNPAYLGWTIAASLSQDLYDGGVRKLSIEQAEIQYKTAIQRYSNDCLIAFREVEFALMSDEAISEQTRLLQKEVKITTLAEKQATRDYSEGLENARILSVLEAQRRAVNARAGLIRIRNQRLQNQVDLFIALGGSP